MDEATTGTSGEVTEVVLFGLRPGVDPGHFLAAAEQVSAWARRQPGFRSRELLACPDGRWMDVVRWASLEEALAAAGRLPDAEACHPMMACIDEATVVMAHGVRALGAVPA